jgi:hypothetical protein
MAAQLKRIDVEKTVVGTKFCISNELRDEQMLVANQRIPGRFAPSESVSEEEIAIVCYGPSLKKNWQELRQFKTIITCSGAHKFLIERGIIPTYHVDLDPREHKVRMLGTPHKDVEYLMASTCHPKMWDVLEGHKVKLWHIYSNEDNKKVALVYPRGDWILTGGNNVGLRCLVIGRLLGYRNFHVFGMDCSFSKDSGHHADTHLNAYPKIYEVPYEGKMYYCEPVMVAYARQFFHEMNQLPDVKVLLHGEGLLQHMAYHKRNEQVKLKPHATIAFSTPVTITPEYTEQLKKLHQNPVYGISGKKHKDVVIKLSEALKTTSIVDYGCGKATLGASLPFPVWEYDPAMPGKDGVPRPADLVCCLSVLSQVEPEMLDNVLGDLVRCSKVCVFAITDMKPGGASLSDGRNVHLISQGKDWWREKLNKFFTIGTILEAGDKLHCVLEPRKMGPLKG